MCSNQDLPVTAEALRNLWRTGVADGAHDHWVLKLRSTRLGLMVLRKIS